jgi:quercetin dioxygenase-like cupin family protein
MKTCWCGVLVLALSSLIFAQQSPVPVEKEPHHQVVLKNDFVMVLRVQLPSGESTLYHVHSHDRVSVHLSDTAITEQWLGEPGGDPSGKQPGDVAATTANGPFTHRVQNVGAAEFDVIDVEFLHRPTQTSGPAAAKVEAENPSARVYKWTLAPGAMSAMHTHQRPYLIISATPLMLKMTDPEGKSFTHEVKAGDIHWVDAKVTHALTNEGTTAGTIVEIELK